MGTSYNSKTVTDGLVFYYDMGNRQKSWIGKPTTNFSYTQNPRIDASYAPYSATSSGTWNANHPDAIRVYNDDNGEISAYSNTGVVDWTNTYHAIWTLDPTLNRPVVTMRDIDGNWKAKSFGLGQTMTSMGLGYGSTYTISWLQWTDDIAKSTNAGLYGLSTGGSNNFHDGLSNSFPTSYNTLPNTWQRVYATFTVSAAWNLTAGLTCYMYGHYIKRGTLKVADVQIETGVPSGFSKTQTRSNIQAIVDITGNNTITATSLTYASDDTFSFNGSNRLNFTMSGSASQSAYTRIVWIKPTSANADMKSVLLNQIGNNSDMAVGIQNGFPAFHQYTKSNAGADLDYSFLGSTAIALNSIYMIAVTVDRTSTTNNIKIYLNGLLNGTTSKDLSLAVSSSDNVIIGGPVSDSFAGARMFYGTVYSASHYNRVLSEAEIQQNFNATRGRYGI